MKIYPIKCGTIEAYMAYSIWCHQLNKINTMGCRYCDKVKSSRKTIQGKKPLGENFPIHYIKRSFTI